MNDCYHCAVFNFKAVLCVFVLFYVTFGFQVNPAVFSRQQNRYLLWYDQWRSCKPLSETQQQCSEWLLSVTSGDDSVTSSKRHVEEYNGQRRYRYTTEHKTD